MKYIFSNDQSVKDAICFRQDHWDDFGWKTYFIMYINDVCIGSIRIAKLRNNEGCQQTWDKLKKDGLVDKVLTMPLPKEYFSLAREDTYANLYSLLRNNQVNELLVQLRDIAYNLEYLKQIEDSNGYMNSLIRGINTTYVKKSLHYISHNRTQSENSFDLEYRDKNWRMDIRSDIDALLPDNLYAIIGDNGVGKSRLLRDIAVAALDDKECKYSYYFNENVNFDLKNSNEISSIIYISLSPFDVPGEDFKNVFALSDNNISESHDSKTDVNAIIKNIIFSFDSNSDEIIKRILSASFRDMVHTDEKKNRIDIVIDEFGWDSDICNLFTYIKNMDSEDEEKFEYELSKVDSVLKKFSSGQKYIVIILLAIIENIIEKSMLIIDEPEDFLHPPYVAALISSISKILNNVKGMGIIATHSDVVLQEIPRKCVYYLDKTRHITHPGIQTFAADVSLINREVFGLELRDTGYYKFLKDLVKENREKAENLLKNNNDLLGENGKFYLSLLLREENRNA